VPLEQFGVESDASATASSTVVPLLSLPDRQTAYVGRFAVNEHGHHCLTPP
jgi:hypothetical protein